MHTSAMRGVLGAAGRKQCIRQEGGMQALAAQTGAASTAMDVCTSSSEGPSELASWRRTDPCFRDDYSGRSVFPRGNVRM